MNTNFKYFCMYGSGEINGYIKQIEISEYTKQIGADALLKAVYDSSSLNATIDCNHTSE